MLRLLKVGLEFEFNLPEQKGGCKGNDVACPCINIDDECWKACANERTCRENPTMEICANRSDACKKKNCTECDTFSFRCIGLACTEFTSVCFEMCDNFSKNCDTCRKKFDPTKDPKSIRDALTRRFKPTNDYTKVNKSGVVSVTEDGSLKGKGGMEIITVGRRIDYYEFYNMAKTILDAANESGAYLNERCGSHMHLLTTYYSGEGVGRLITELERNMPEVILANFHQLCRRYQNAMTWMTMALSEPNHMTRWEKFRVSILGVSPIQRDMVSLRDKVAHDSGGRKYGWVNYNKMQFTNSGDISAFHVEMRGADSTMCPSYYAAVACLYVALAIKAVEISRYGVLRVADEGGRWLKKAKEAKNAIMNNTGGYDGPRVANTENAMYFRDYYIDEGMDMLSQLKGILMRLGPAYDVLTKLIQRPPALRRCDGESWEDIERAIEVPISQSGKLDNKLQEIIDLRLLEECESIEEWISGATNIITEEWGDELDEVSESDIQRFTETKMRDGLVIWSDSIGGVIAI